MHLFRSFSIFFLVTSSLARADVTLGPLFSDHAVLQQAKPIPVWGRAEAGEHVTVTFHEQTVGATTAADGRWIVFLDALPASNESAELVVTGKNTVRINDVLVGEVWLCSGQSNMEFQVRNSLNAEQEIAAANFPLIRQVKIKRAVSETPSDSAEGEWTLCSPTSAAEFTAVGYFFARDLHQRLNVPIGLINSTWGGTPVEAWLSPAALASNPAFSVVKDRWQHALADYPHLKTEYDTALATWTAEETAAKSHGEKFSKNRPNEPMGHGSPWTPSGLFNGMINPLLPYALRGALWYQGESNTNRAREYHALFSSMIAYWRQHFGQPDFPFLWVQLANFKGGNGAGTDWAFLREAQTQTLSLPATGQAVIIDLGESENIHPRDKQEVGRRLALIARTKVYQAPVDFSGPIFTRAEQAGPALRLYFDHAQGGLTASERPLQSFALAGADQKFYAASARIERDTVVVSAPEVKEPIAVRYAWSNDPFANLYNGAGLPACPFRSDNW